MNVEVSEALRGIRRIFLDTAPVIYYVEENKRYISVLDFVFARLDDRAIQPVTSPVTLAECLVAPLRSGDKPLIEQFTRRIVGQSHFVQLDQSLAQEAASLRAAYNLRLLDAIQVATAISAQCDAFLTNDLGLSRVTELKIIVLDELQGPPAPNP